MKSSAISHHYNFSDGEVNVLDDILNVEGDDLEEAEPEEKKEKKERSSAPTSK